MNRTFLKRWFIPEQNFSTDKRRQRQSLFLTFFLFLILIILGILIGIDFSDEIANPGPVLSTFLGQDIFLIGMVVIFSGLTAADLPAWRLMVS